MDMTVPGLEFARIVAAPMTIFEACRVFGTGVFASLPLQMKLLAEKAWEEESPTIAPIPEFQSVRMDAQWPATGKARVIHADNKIEQVEVRQVGCAACGRIIAAYVCRPQREIFAIVGACMFVAELRIVRIRGPNVSDAIRRAGMKPGERRQNEAERA